MPNTAKPPHDMAEAYATATDPYIHGGNRAICGMNWAFMKEARGQQVDFTVLDQIHPHPVLIRPAPAPVAAVAQPVNTPVNTIDAARIGAIPRIRRVIFGDPTGGKGAA